MKKINKLTELKPDPSNFNKHTNFGMSLLEKSMRQHGFMEAGVISEDGVIISGNARQEVANNIGLKNVEIIDTDGKKAIYLRAKGIKSGTKEFHELALKLNATAKANIEFDEPLLEEFFTDEIMNEWGIGTKTSNGQDLSGKLSSEFKIEIDCESEREQEKLFNEFQKNGYKCRILTL